ncbi:heterokaryon incompatibility protein-domain-containing protein [Xylaria arbuscula]|nr:heterokaryon incompatibility protein-domain-containing protein [Xylaria arbuscula]
MFSSENLQEYSRFIPLAKLQNSHAKTFKDAIQITRSLGFRYIWIDALCIKQNDTAEKVDEIACMDQIYAHAVLNLSATSAINGSGGLIFPRNPLIVNPCVSEQHDLLAYASEYETQVIQGIVNRRAWVLQERLMARRVLHFTSNQLFWECPFWEVSESQLAGFFINISSTSFGMKSNLIPEGASSYLTERSMRAFWPTIVRSYTKCALSFRQDTMPGISALARVICRSRGLGSSDYVAGMWMPDLPQQLLWRVSGCSLALPTEYIAPSWSWAGFRHPSSMPATLDMDDMIPLAEIVEVSITPKTRDAFGEIDDGHITLRAHIGVLHVLRTTNGLDFQVGVRNIARPIDLKSSFHRNESKHCYADARFVDEMHENTYYEIRYSETQGNLLRITWDHGWLNKHDVIQDGFFPLASGERVAFETSVFFLVTIGYSPCRSSVGWLSGLVLQSAVARGQYLRVGHFRFNIPNSQHKERLEDVEDPEEENLELRRLVLGQGITLDDGDFLYAHNDGTSTIQII